MKNALSSRTILGAALLAMAVVLAASGCGQDGPPDGPSFDLDLGVAVDHFSSSLPDRRAVGADVALGADVTPGTDAQGGTGADAAVAGDSAPAELDGGAAADVGSSSDAGANTVALSYAPGWAGVTQVTVIGGFGQSTDWHQPLLTLDPQADGTFSGTTQLPAGNYLYAFQVTGDAAQGSSPLKRVIVDPTNTELDACPMAAPGFSTDHTTPCSKLTVPQPAPAPARTVAGRVTVSGMAAPGYLVVLERDQAPYHHTFANRVTSGSDGAFQLAGVTGQWRVQVLHPTYFSSNDSQRDPLTLKAARRLLSSVFPLDADVSLPAAEASYPGYAAMSPKAGQQSMPLSFHYSVIPGATAARVDVYGKPGAAAGAIQEIGDPWFASASSATATQVAWDGTFNTAQAEETRATSGETYFWGTSQSLGGGSGGVSWTLQSMVFPVVAQ